MLLQATAIKTHSQPGLFPADSLDRSVGCCRRYLHEIPDHLTPDRVFDRQWALALLDRVLQKLQQEFSSGGRQSLFEALKVFLPLDQARAAVAEIAGQLSMSEGAAKVAIHRMRKRYRALLRDEIAHTISAPGEVEAEIRELFAAFRSYSSNN